MTMLGSRGAVRRFCRNGPALLGLALLAFVAGAALSADIVASTGPLDIVGRPFLWPWQRPQFPLGTDGLGRDVLAGLMHGSRVSLLVGLAAAAVALAIGVPLGAAAGYFRGRTDEALMRFTEVFQTLPPFLFLIVLVAIFKPSVATIIGAIGLVSWPMVARLVRGEFIRLRDRDFVQAAVTAGVWRSRIILRDVLPNALPPIVVVTSVLVATAILNEAALSFLGLGDPNVMSWGTMIGNGREALRTAWYLTAIPGLAIIVTVLALNLVGDGLNDALDPRSDVS